MKAKLNEVTFTFHIPIDEGRNWRQIKLLAGKLGGKLTWAFVITGREDILPVEVVDGIAEALAWCKTQVNEADLREHDRDCCID